MYCFKNSFHCQFIIQERYLNIIKAKKYHKIGMRVKLSNSIMIIHKYAPFKPNIHEKYRFSLPSYISVLLAGTEEKGVIKEFKCYGIKMMRFFFERC